MGMSQLLTVSASTKRAAISSGKRSAPVTRLTGLVCAPVMPIGEETRNGAPTEAPIQQWETFLSSSPDIHVGDQFIASSVTYTVVQASKWPWADGTTYTRLVLEELRDGSSGG
jgi:hypothetical protein